MNKQIIYQIDAFTTQLFGGNPAAVCPLKEWLSDDLMQAIARENNLSETAFFVRNGERYHIRWFTPNTEVSLCGHATLASAYVIFKMLGHEKDQIIFDSLSGELCVNQRGEQLQLNFPILPYTQIEPSTELLAAINVIPQAVYKSTLDLLLILKNESEVEKAMLDLNAISLLPHRGVILSAPSAKADVYSRCFYPGCDVPEDPVTGSAHCVIAPYWCDYFKKNTIHALQGLKRQGQLICEIKDKRVLLSGTCRLYLQGEIFLG